MSSYRLLDNSRFYVLASSVLVSFVVAAWLRITIEADQLYYIRLQQTMGLFSLVYWYVALLISPLGYVVGKERLRYWVFARRAIGVSAAYFALVHLTVALWGQLGGPGELGRLPDLIQTSLIFGFAGVIVLLIMAATSFDIAVKRMTYRRWKLLHRTIYTAFVLVVLHIWMLGTHVTYVGVQWVAIAALLLLAGLESYRMLKNLDAKRHFLDSRVSGLLMLLVVLAAWLFVILSIPALFDNYHSKHHEGSHAE